MGWSCDASVGEAMQALPADAFNPFVGFEVDRKRYVLYDANEGTGYRDGRAKVGVAEIITPQKCCPVAVFDLVPATPNGIVYATKAGHKYIRALGLDPERVFVPAWMQ